MYASCGFLKEAQMIFDAISERAKELLISMPFHLNLVGWKSLLRHCKTFGNVELGRECFDNDAFPFQLQENILNVRNATLVF